MGERFLCKEKVAGSSPVISTMRVSPSGKAVVFQTTITGSNPVTRSYARVAQRIEQRSTKPLMGVRFLSLVPLPI